MLKEDPDYSDREETRQDLIETLEAEIESALPLDKEVFGFHFEEAGFSMSQNTGGESETAAVTVESDGDILIPVREFNVGSLERFIDGIENNEAPEQIAAFRENIPEVMVDAPDAKITVDATPGFEFK